jgi:conjugative transfer signal peptidase TraF
MSARAILILGAAAIGIVAISHAIPRIPRLIWNASPSVPIGLYGVHPDTPPHAGDLVAVSPPKPLGLYMAVRHYLPLGLPLLKHLAATAGATVCRNRLDIVLNGHAVARALPNDRKGRPLPDWQGCHRIKPGEVFLLNPAVPDSFDGRYFGTLPASSLLGRAVPLIVVATP